MSKMPMKKRSNRSSEGPGMVTLSVAFPASRVTQFFSDRQNLSVLVSVLDEAIACQDRKKKAEEIKTKTKTKTKKHRKKKA